ncbi:cell division protein FtsI/penicillin-binding protein 2 [Luteococcus japonicus]|uniref:Beta-lactamase n=1 Tax=Luteococcus japonicus TaxID=33984 RepID=A0A3N1ZVL5_9ACTN|nr:penicillin-binding transpeptidase domain-containing protein [Luteococcus japonicus]ROR54875.1 cell division protein FtsI/penicillin-binding protein 2 [Luteococcus japonicus]
MKSAAHLLALPTLAALLATTACTGGQDTTPPKNLPAADDAAKQFAAALAKGDVLKAPVVDAGPAQTELQVLTNGMDDLRPTITPGQVTYDGKSQSASVPLDHKLQLGSQTWSWQTTAPLKFVDGAWKVEWNPKIVQADLDGNTRLRHLRDAPKRASIVGSEGMALVEMTTAYQVGVDKASTAKTQWDATARKLAATLGLDAANYAKQVAAAGHKAFVPAITLRAGKVPETVKEMAGVSVIPVEMPLAPSSTFAAGILGGSGLASPEDVKAGKGDVEAADHVGTSGLQKRYDAQLRGSVGHRIDVVGRKVGTEAPTAAPASPGTSPSPAPDKDSPVKELFSSPAKPGTPVALSLNRGLQEKAEKALASQKGVASLVVLKVGSGDILAAANSPASGANPNATFGRYAPGSTFKVVSSLALLRKGVTPTTKVPCTANLTVNGRVFKNYTDFPSSKVGNITLTDALANSCNTAFLASAPKLGDSDLAQAAASLGMGMDHDAGFSSFFGSVPPAKDPVGKAADMIGQGTVEASPMAMAAVAASVASGKTVVPWLVASKKPTQKGTPLSPTEAKQLQQMMRAVVTDGSGKVLAGKMDGAKTGTAEFGSKTPPQTHAWMIAWNKDYAVAAMVAEGESGSKTAAPIIKSFLG